MQLQIVDIPRCTHNYHIHKHMEPPDVAYEPLVQLQSIPDVETAVPIQKQTKYPESLGCSSSNLVYVTRQGKSLIKSDP